MGLLLHVALLIRACIWIRAKVPAVPLSMTFSDKAGRAWQETSRVPEPRHPSECEQTSLDMRQCRPIKVSEQLFWDVENV